MLFVPISLVFINFLSSFIIIMTTHIQWDAESEKLILSAEPNSWYHYFYTESKYFINTIIKCSNYVFSRTRDKRI